MSACKQNIATVANNTVGNTESNVSLEYRERERDQEKSEFV